MKVQTVCAGLVVVALLLVLAGGAVAGPEAPEATVAGKINYQGRLTDASGAPLTGTYVMRFQIHNVAGGGAVLWDSGDVNVEVDHGLFNVPLSVTTTLFNGQGLWLKMQVGGEWLSPLQEMVPVPYALSLRPGADVTDSLMSSYILKVTNNASPGVGAISATAATGSAVYGSSPGYGLKGYSDSGNAVVAQSNSKTAGVFTTNEGYGITVDTNGIDHWDHAGYFTANMGYGLYVISEQNNAIRGQGGTDLSGVAQPAGRIGVGGLSATNFGVFGSSRDAEGVWGTSNERSGVYGETDQTDYGLAASVWGQKSSGQGNALRALKYGTFGYGAWVSNYGDGGSGLYVDSTNGTAVYAWTARTDNDYGIYTPDNLYSLNYNLAGAIMQVVQNAGTEALEPGDLAVFSGIARPKAEGDMALIQVARAGEANSTALAGVVYGRFDVRAVDGTWRPDGSGVESGAEVTPPGPVQPGEYLLLVVQGPAQVKVSSVAGAIHPGDLLSAAGVAGQAGRAAQVEIGGVPLTPPGTVVGKALEPLAGDKGLIYVFVTLQ